MADNIISNPEEYVSPTGEYIIPVEWAVYSTIKVSGKNIKNLQDAIDWAEANLEDIPLSTESEYIDGSYQLNTENAVDAQNYQHIGNDINADDFE